MLLAHAAALMSRMSLRTVFLKSSSSSIGEVKAPKVIFFALSSSISWSRLFKNSELSEFPRYSLLIFIGVASRFLYSGDFSDYCCYFCCRTGDDKFGFIFFTALVFFARRLFETSISAADLEKFPSKRRSRL